MSSERVPSSVMPLVSGRLTRLLSFPFFFLWVQPSVSERFWSRTFTVGNEDDLRQVISVQSFRSDVTYAPLTCYSTCDPPPPETPGRISDGGEGGTQKVGFP